MSRSVHTIAIPSSTEYLKKVRQFVVSHALAANFPEEIAEIIKICVDEACTNVIKHAYEGKTGHEVGIDIIVEPDCLIVCIKDRGKSFDKSKYHEPNVKQLTMEGASGGLGVHIMLSMMDKVEYLQHGAVNELRLTKYYPFRSEHT